MIKVESIEVWGWESAIRGMRNPMNSWKKSDTLYCDRVDCDPDRTCPYYGEGGCHGSDGGIVLGKNDLDLMRRLFKAGTEHRKYLRMIHVTMDIVAPLYWWKEFDTYKVGTVANSCSTMHKIATKEFTIGDFSRDHIPMGSDAFNDTLDFRTSSNFFAALYPENSDTIYLSAEDILELTIMALNHFRGKYLETKDKSYWWQMIQLLPSSYNQRRTVDFDYETAFSIIRQRTGHKLDEWNEFVKVLNDLPYVKDIGDLNGKTETICD